MKKFGLLFCLLLGLTACGQNADVETVDDPQPQYFATMEEAVEACLEQGFEEPLSVEKIGETELVVAYAKGHHSIALFVFTKQPEGYVLMEETVNYGIPENGGAVMVSFDAPWEGEVDYEVTAAGFDHEPTTKELEENGLGLCHEDEGFYFAVKVDRYEFLRTLTTTVDY